MNRTSTISTMTLDGGAPCLDFVNSGYDREKDVLAERLHSYEDLLTLAERLGFSNGQYLNSLRNKALTLNQDADLALIFARDCRLKLYTLFAALAQQRPEDLSREALKAVNNLFAEAHKFNLLTKSDNSVIFAFQPMPDDLSAPVWWLVLSAYNLLREGNVHHIKQCQRCSWLFIDQTKNHRKKWCSMESCGNAQKVKRYYALQKANAVGEI